MTPLTQTLYTLAVFAICGTAMAEGLKVAATPPWTMAKDQKLYTLDYSGQGYPGLSCTVEVKPDTYYKLGWKMRCSAPESEASFALGIEVDGRRRFDSYVLTDGWSDYAAYFHSAKGGEVKLRPYANPGQPKTIAVKDLEVTPVTPETFRRNLLPDGDFELSSGVPANWRKTWGTTTNPAVVVSSQDFLSGEKSLEVAFAKGGLQSVQMPVVLGKEVEFKFWAKAESDRALTVSIQAWSPFGHRGEHFYKMDKIKVTPEWREYSCELTVSTDTAKYPDLLDRLMFVSVAGEKDRPGKVRFDGLVFHEVDGD